MLCAIRPHGLVLDYVEGYYLVQLCSWDYGHATNQVLFSFEEMKDWCFYDSTEAMVHYEKQPDRKTRSKACLSVVEPSDKAGDNA